MAFNDRDYTYDAIVKQLGLIELHSKDGSASEENCKCIGAKHLYLLEGLSEEGQGFGLTSKENEFYAQLGDFARKTRKRMELEDWSLHGVMREVMKKEHPKPLHNPRGRDFLPSHLTACEKAHPKVQAKLKSCIKEAELKCCGEYTTDYSLCTCNPVSVCRTSIPCPQ